MTKVTYNDGSEETFDSDTYEISDNYVELSKEDEPVAIIFTENVKFIKL